MLKLYDHQLQCIDLAIKTGVCCGLFLEPGLGKTITTYSIFDYLRSRDNNVKLIVTCPKSLIFAAWHEDHAKYFSKYKIIDFETYCKKQKEFDVLVLNYEKLQTKNWAKHAMNVLQGTVMWACDESSKMKSNRTHTSQILLKIARYAKYRIILSGTPHPNGLHELWAQIRFIQPDVFPKSFHSWKNTYFHLERGGQELYMRGKVMTRDAARELFSKGWKWSITEANRKKLMDKIAPFVIYKHKDECLDLPEKIDLKRYVEFTKEEAALYKEMRRDLMIEVQNKVITAQLVLTKIMKLRQLTGGFIMDEQGGCHQTSTAKMRELVQVMHELGDSQCIVWGHFVHEIKTIEEALLKEGYSVVTYYSGTTDREKSYNDFKNGDAQILVANPQSCAHGLTLTNCNQQVWYSMSYSYEQYTQGKDRIHRISQHNACTYTHLLIKDSIDEVIYDALQNKADINDIAMKLVMG